MHFLPLGDRVRVYLRMSLRSKSMVLLVEDDPKSLVALVRAVKRLEWIPTGSLSTFGDDS
jgi:hypothetical protein